MTTRYTMEITGDEPSMTAGFIWLMDEDEDGDRFLISLDSDEEGIPVVYGFSAEQAEQIFEWLQDKVGNL